MRPPLAFGIGIAAALAVTMLALHRGGHETPGDPTTVGEPGPTARADTRVTVPPPVREAALSLSSPERPPEASALTAPPRSEPPPEKGPPSVADRADERVLGAWMAQDDALAHKGLAVPPRTYRGFTPTTQAMATGLMMCDLDMLTMDPNPAEGPCAADTALMERIARGADSTTGVWAANTENLLRDFFEEHGPFTVEQVICSDGGCIIDGLGPSHRNVPWDESIAADFEALTKLRAELWYQVDFEGGGGWTITPGDIRALRLERIIVLKRRTTP